MNTETHNSDIHKGPTLTVESHSIIVKPEKMDYQGHLDYQSGLVYVTKALVIPVDMVQIGAEGVKDIPPGKNSIKTCYEKL